MVRECDRRSEAFVKIHIFFYFLFFFGGGEGEGRVRGGQGGWEQRIEAFVKIQKKNIFFLGGGGGGSGRGVGLGGQGG